MKKKKSHLSDLIGQIVLVSTLLGLLILGYLSLKTDNAGKFQSLERLRGDCQIAPIQIST